MRKTAAFISAYLIGMSAIVCMIAVSLYPTPSPAMPFSNPVMQAYIITDYDHQHMMAFPTVMTIMRQAEKRPSLIIVKSGPLCRCAGICREPEIRRTQFHRNPPALLAAGFYSLPVAIVAWLAPMISNV